MCLRPSSPSVHPFGKFMGCSSISGGRARVVDTNKLELPKYETVVTFKQFSAEPKQPKPGNKLRGGLKKNVRSQKKRNTFFLRPSSCFFWDLRLVFFETFACFFWDLRLFYFEDFDHCKKYRGPEMPTLTRWYANNVDDHGKNKRGEASRYLRSCPRT